jgi:uncharacterized protein YlzI (FlbEa/FlbD family)
LKVGQIEINGNKIKLNPDTMIQIGNGNTFMA